MITRSGDDILGRCNSLSRVNEMLKAASECDTNLKASSYKTNNACRPFATQHGVPTFEYYSQHPEKALRFAKAMTELTKSMFGTLLSVHTPDKTPFAS